MNNYTVAEYFVKGQKASSAHFHTFREWYGNGEQVCHSYSTKIAPRTDNAVLLDDRFYSMTTRKHQVYIKRAAARQGVRVVEVFCLSMNEKGKAENLRGWKEQAAEARKKASRARTEHGRNFWEQEAARIRSTRAAYLKIYAAHQIAKQFAAI